MTNQEPQWLAEIRGRHEEAVDIANDSEGFPGELNIDELDRQTLLAYTDRLRVTLEDWSCGDPDSAMNGDCCLAAKALAWKPEGE